MPAHLLRKTFDEIRDSGWFAQGKYTRLFEEEVSLWCEMPSVAVSSCGAGLFAILRSLRKRSGIAVVSPNTFFATGAMAKEAGYVVVGADCSRRDFCLTAETLAQYAPANTDVVILTHVGGGVAHDYLNIAAWCNKHEVYLVEDAAHALGAGTDGMYAPCAGWLGTAAVFSCYATKAVPIGEGGVVVSQSAELVEKVRQFCNYGKRMQDGRVRYNGVGFNLRMSEWQAAIGYLQMKRLPEILEKRAAAAHALKRIVAPLVTSDYSNWYKFIAPVEYPAKRVTGQVYAASDQLTSAMSLAGEYPNAAWVAANHICLPIEEGLYEGMSDGEIGSYLESAPCR
jgi:dTDP-4-amino-4,6-dideoxygalactose transaminase